MEKINQYVSLVNQAFAVAKENFNNPESLKKAEADKLTLVNSLEKDSFIKVPFVGDFNAGKSLQTVFHHLSNYSHCFQH